MNDAALEIYEIAVNLDARWSDYVEACKEAGVCPYCINGTTCETCDGGVSLPATFDTY